MPKFSDILGELTPYFAKGLETGMAEERATRQRRQLRAEEEEYAIRGEERKAVAAQAAAEREATELGALGQALGLPVPAGPATFEAGPPALADILREPTVTPGKPRLPKAGIPLLSQAMRAQPRERATPVTPFAIGRQIALQTGATPEAALQAGIESAARATGAGAQARQQVKAAGEIAEFEPVQQTVDTVKAFTSNLITATTPTEAAVQAGRLHLGAMTGFNPQARAYRDSRQAFLGVVARQLGGERGVLTDRDIGRIDAIVPGFSDTAESARLKIGIMDNALKAAIAAKERVARGEISLSTARREVTARVEELLKPRTQNLPSGWVRE